MEFARDWKRLFGRPSPRSPDPAVAELLFLPALTAEAQAMARTLTEAGVRERPGLRLQLAAVLREIARRSGRPETLLSAASMAAKAAAEGTLAEAAAARVEQALCGLLTAELFGDPEGVEAAQAHLVLAGEAGQGGLALVAARDALAAGDLDKAIEAAGRLDATVGNDLPLAVEARLARADLLVGFGRKLSDRALLQRAEVDLAEGCGKLDPDYRPVSWARLEALRGQALVAMGELSAETEVIARGCSALAAAAGHVDADHSPLDHARCAHALGLGLLALAEASGEGRAVETLTDQAISVLEPALAIVEKAPGLPLRAVVAHDRASALARRAERRLDGVALADAERLFRGELARCDARRDPVGWAVTQVALARVYESRAGLGAGPARVPEAALALSAAFDVFTERGLKGLAETASAALARVRALA